MNTPFLLLAQYQTAVVPLEFVCRDYFQHLTPAQLWRKYNEGTINLPITVMEPGSQKSAKGVALRDLADYIDARMEAARTEIRQLNR